MAVLEGQGRLSSRHTAPECGGDRTGRRRGRRPFPVDCWLREYYVGGLGLPECSVELGVPFIAVEVGSDGGRG